MSLSEPPDLRYFNYDPKLYWLRGLGAVLFFPIWFPIGIVYKIGKTLLKFVYNLLCDIGRWVS